MPGVAAPQLAAVADVFAQFDAKTPADAFFARALDVQNLTADQRYDLLWRRAAVNAGLPRWRCLLMAAALAPAGSTQRAQCVQIVLKELDQPIHAATAATLAGETKDAALQAAIVLRQAELSPDPAVSGGLAWQLYQDGRLPASSLLWACQQWSGKPGRVIAALERDLRAGKDLAKEQAEVLEQAYRAVGRTLDARRAATSDPAPVPPASSQRQLPMGGGGMF